MISSCLCLYEQSGTQTAVKSFDKIVEEVISSIKKKSSLVEKMIKAQEQTAVAQAEELQLQLENEIVKLKKRAADLQQLSHMDDHIHFIQVPDAFQCPMEQISLLSYIIISLDYFISQLHMCE